MSRIGKKIIEIPDKVKVSLNKDDITVEGPKGKLSMKHIEHVNVELDGSTLSVKLKNDVKKFRSFHGLTRSLLNNMVVGVTEGFKKDLLIKGVGYRAMMKGKTLTLHLGYSHPIEIDIPEGIDVSVEKNVNLSVSGIDKREVGFIASLIRSQRKPEPYKGKGIRYADEMIKMKAGKTAGK